MRVNAALNLLFFRALCCNGFVQPFPSKTAHKAYKTERRSLSFDEVQRVSAHINNQLNVLESKLLPHSTEVSKASDFGLPAIDIFRMFKEAKEYAIPPSITNLHLSFPNPSDFFGLLGDMFLMAVTFLQTSLVSEFTLSQSEGYELAFYTTSIALGTVATISTLAAFSFFLNKPKAEIPTKFDLEKLDEYYKGRPFTLVSRLVYVSFTLASFALQLWLDSVQGNWELNMPKRARLAKDLLYTTGPAYIKLGQGVSIRPDILPEPYLLELQKLQDQVPPFDSEVAIEIIENELGARIEDVFVSREDFKKPVAAASLGQVYQARLKENGITVAVKVQRPKVLEAVTIDLYVTRLILLALSLFPNFRDSSLAFLAVIDSFGSRFLDELDYLQEAKNGERFCIEMSKSEELGKAILVPKVFNQYNTRYLLISEWIEGERINKIDVTAKEGRERLEKIVATLLNAYLTQLLETGFLHADPHPGNFLCTPDGRLCILDYGLMTEVTEDQRYAILEYVSHLSAKDYEATLNDLIILGFIPKEVGEDPAKAAIVAPLLGHVLEQLVGGGGVKAMTVETVGEEIEELGKQYPVMIPSYFGLIIRAFSALEGLGLQLDPKYSITKQCFPYLSRRLLTEDTPKMKRMLKTFLYGKEGKTLKVERVDEIVSGYSSFTALADEASKGLGMGQKVPMLGPSVAEMSGAFAMKAENVSNMPSRIVPFSNEEAPPDLLNDPVARDALKLLFNKDGNYVQDLVIEEMVRMTDAFGRETNLQILSALRSISSAPLSPVTVLRAISSAPMNPLTAPIQLLSKLQLVAFDRIITRLEIALELTAEDQEALTTLSRLVEIFRGNNPQNVSSIPIRVANRSLRNGGKEVREAARALAGIVSLIGPGATSMSQKYVRQLFSRALKRLAENIEERPLEGGKRGEMYLPSASKFKR